MQKTKKTPKSQFPIFFLHPKTSYYLLLFFLFILLKPSHSDQTYTSPPTGISSFTYAINDLGTKYLINSDSIYTLDEKVLLSSTSTSSISPTMVCTLSSGTKVFADSNSFEIEGQSSTSYCTSNTLITPFLKCMPDTDAFVVGCGGLETDTSTTPNTETVGIYYYIVTESDDDTYTTSQIKKEISKVKNSNLDCVVDSNSYIVCFYLSYRGDGSDKKRTFFVGLKYSDNELTNTTTPYDDLQQGSSNWYASDLVEPEFTYEANSLRVFTNDSREKIILLIIKDGQYLYCVEVTYNGKQLSKIAPTAGVGNYAVLLNCLSITSVSFTYIGTKRQAHICQISSGYSFSIIALNDNLNEYSFELKMQEITSFSSQPYLLPFTDSITSTIGLGIFYKSYVTFYLNPVCDDTTSTLNAQETYTTKLITLDDLTSYIHLGNNETDKTSSLHITIDDYSNSEEDFTITATHTSTTASEVKVKLVMTLGSKASIEYPKTVKLSYRVANSSSQDSSDNYYGYHHNYINFKFYKQGCLGMDDAETYCTECDTGNGYYPLYDSNNNIEECYQKDEATILRYYLNSNNNYSLCSDSGNCKYCSGASTTTNSNCYADGDQELCTSGDSACVYNSSSATENSNYNYTCKSGTCTFTCLNGICCNYDDSYYPIYDSDNSKVLTDLCVTEKDGYYLNSTKKYFESCGNGCRYCTSETVKDTTAPCTPKSTSSSQCLDDYYRVSSSDGTEQIGTCIASSTTTYYYQKTSTIKITNDEGNEEEVEDTYFVACADNCKTCTEKGCTSCDDYYYYYYENDYKTSGIVTCLTKDGCQDESSGTYKYSYGDELICYKSCPSNNVTYLTKCYDSCSSAETNNSVTLYTYNSVCYTSCSDSSIADLNLYTYEKTCVTECPDGYDAPDTTPGTECEKSECSFENLFFWDV